MREIIAALTEHAGGLTKADLARRCGTSLETVQRAMDRLRNEYGAPIEAGRVWRLTARFSLPLLAPQPDDLTAVVLAGALLQTIADPDLEARVQALVAELDQRLRDAGARRLIPARGMSATMTFGTRLDRKRLETILHATRGGVLDVEHRKIWREEGEPPRRRIQLEPWSCRVHDGMAYVRGYARQRGGPRTYRIADFQSVRVVDNPGSTATRPPPDDIWGDRDPRSGIDVDRPAEARIVIKGPLARWFEPVVLHPKQTTQWLEPDEILERRVPYRSCRELARRLLSIIDGLVEVDPPELRMEINRYVKAARDRGLITEAE